MSANPLPRYTPEQYLSLERTAETKHEYYQGEIFAMAGASENHCLLASNLLFLLVGATRNSPCRAYGSDMRVLIDESGLYTYPDVAVTCEHPEFLDGRKDTLLNPQLLIEVLSPSTESYDRGKKFEHYRRLESLKEYLLVSQDEAHIDHYVKEADGRWVLDDFSGLEAELSLHSVPARLPLAEVYRQVSFETPPT